jgi:hypothetical protein
VNRSSAHRTMSWLTATSLALGTAGLATAFLAGTPAGADTSLGGFTVAATADAATFTYEQPNFPLPATPTLELDEGYANATDNFGPVGSATASSLYPGQVVANAGPQLALLLPGVPLPPAPVWPIQAVSQFPQAPNSASSDQPGLTMEASSTANGNTATAAFGNANATTPGTGGGALGPGLPTLPTLGGLLGLGSSPGPSNPLALTSSLLGIQAISSTASSTATGATAQGTGTAIDTGVSILGGLIYLGSLNSTATVSSDGTTAKITGGTTVTGASLAGEAVTIDANGIHAAGNSTPAIPIATLVQTLQTAGITITLTNPTNTVTGSKGTSQLDGLRIQIDLTQLDQAASTLSKLLPAQLISNLPLPPPNKQILALDLGEVTAASSASPAFVFDAGGTTGTGSSTAASPSDLGSSTPSSSGLGSSGTGFTPSGTGTSPTGPSSASPPAAVQGIRSSAVTPVFKGIGAGLVLLGVLAAIALTLAAARATSLATAGLGEGVGGAGGPDDPLGGGYGDGDVTDAEPWDSTLALEPEGPMGPGGAI